MEHVQAIRERREKTVLRALTTLELYAAGDAETSSSLLQLSAKSVADPRVAARWIELLATETDQGKRQTLLRELAKLDFRQIPDSDACVTQLLSCLNQPDAREWALYCLTRIAPQNPKIIPPLVDAYRAQRDDRVARRILAMLLSIGELTDALIAFFISVLDAVNAETKTVLVKRLLERDALQPAQLAKLLIVSEPPAIKALVLDHAIDRSIQLNRAATDLLRNDPDAACRYAAAWALTETGAPTPEALDALLHAASADSDDRVRLFTICAFEHTLAKTPAVIRMLLDALKTETSVPRASLIVKLLAPHLQRAPEIVPALTTLLEANLQTEIALEIYSQLGTLAPWNAAVREFLIAACTREKEDRVKATILKPLSQLNLCDPKLVALYGEALKLPHPGIQTWGLQGILLLPATPDNVPLIAQSVEALLMPDISLHWRLALAQKLAALPEKSAALLERLKFIAANARESELKRVCEDVFNTAASDALDTADVQIDWESWIHRAEVEHRGDGIFPALYEHYESAPAQARRVLKALLNPQCSDNLYGLYGYDVNEGVILAYLESKDAVDDDVSRFCVGRTLNQNAGTPNLYLQTLLANPTFPGLKDAVWQILEKRQDASPALLRTLLITAHSSQDAAVAAFSARMNTRSGEALKPYARLLLENLGWPPARALIKSLATRKDLPAALRDQLAAAMKKLGIANAPDNPPQPAGPGFADE